MRYVAIILLSVLGIIEFLARATVLLAIAISVVGLFFLYPMIESMDDPQDLLLPFAFKAVERLLEEGDALNRQVEDSKKRIDMLQVENRELQELLVASDQ